jgi:hypothetical protein
MTNLVINPFTAEYTFCQHYPCAEYILKKKIIMRNNNILTLGEERRVENIVITF